MDIRTYRKEDEAAVIQLWHRCNLIVPQNNPHKDILRKCARQPELFLVGEEDGHIIASVMVGYDGHRGWLNYVAVDPDHQRTGLGRQLLAEAEQRLRALGCPKISLQVRRSNARVCAFYRKIGFVEDDVISFGKRLEND